MSIITKSMIYILKHRRVLQCCAIFILITRTYKSRENIENKRIIVHKKSSLIYPYISIYISYIY